MAQGALGWRPPPRRIPDMELAGTHPNNTELAERNSDVNRRRLQQAAHGPLRVTDTAALERLVAGAREAALAARPRYHVAGSRRTFYARAPYLNADLGAGAHVTRFVGLAEVGNPAKQKWLHALGLAPAVEMTPEQLQAVPEGSTASPYAAGGGGEEGEGPGGRKRGVKEEEDLGSQDWRWQQQQKRQKGPGGPVAAPSLGACVLGCWQCMAAGGLWGGMGGCAGFTRACPPPFGAAV